MKVIIAFDSFKGSLGSAEAGAAAAAGVAAADSTADIRVIPVADGGEGTLDALLAALGGREVPVDTVDALGRPISAAYGLIEDAGRSVAIIEAARAIGLDAARPLDVSVAPRASSYGLAALVRHAVAAGAERLVVTLGGTATTDGGTGLLAGLGAILTDHGGAQGSNPLWSGVGLVPGTLPDLSPVELTVLADVRSPMTGPDGAAAVFGPQKGATPVQVQRLEERMVDWAAELRRESGRDVGSEPGSGAAGGLGGAFLALGATIDHGFAHVARMVALAEALQGADLVFTGEGSIDAQTGRGKAPAGVATMARAAGAVVIGLGGRVVRPREDLEADAVLPIHSRLRPVEEAMSAEVTRAEIAASARELTRLVLAVAGNKMRATTH